MQSTKIDTAEFLSLTPDRKLALYYKELASINEEIARLAVDMLNLSPDEREEVRLYLRGSSKESAKQSGKITTVNELLSRLVQP